MESKTMSRPQASGEKQLSLFQTVIGPINFISFLLSLYLVDCHYHEKRFQEHSERYSRLPSWLLPGWLHRLLFRPRPYGWVDQGKRGTAGGGGKKERWYFHTKQRKLMKMEAADAFELQRTVLLGLGVLVLAAAWVFWRLCIGAWAWYRS